MGVDNIRVMRLNRVITNRVNVVMPKKAFDYIIVGAGSSGCVLASRLSEDPSVSVCLLEAGGPDTSVFIHAPLGAAAMLPTKINNWAFETIPQKGLKGRKGYQPRGKTLGGSSSTNAMLYVRGNKWDYDHWRSLGNKGWGYADVLPYFKKSEHNEALEDEFHGQGGPLNVSNATDASTLNKSFIESCELNGVPVTADYNGKQQEGAFMYQRTVINGERCSAAKAYLTPNVGRSNLTIYTHALSEKVIIKNHKAVGVRFKQQGDSIEIFANKEVLLSGGAFGSPQLLMLSGIGPADHLREKGIDVIKDLSGVGQNLQDHIDYVQTFKTDSRSDTFGLSIRGSVKMLQSMLQWKKHRTGKVTSTIAESGAFFKSSEAIEIPDLQLVWIAGIVDDHARKVNFGHGYSCHITLLRPKSVGEVKLDTANPEDALLIDPKFFNHPDDMTVLLEGAKRMQKILMDKPFDGVRGGMLYNVEAGDDVALENDIRNRADTQYHPIGTCKMGTKEDVLAVVDNELRVYGIDSLRVVDASVMPSLIGGNTNAPCIMMGEKAADMIRAGSRVIEAEEAVSECC